MRRILLVLLAATGLVLAGPPALAEAPRVNALLIGGDPFVAGSYRCTIGFNAYDPDTRDRYILTSGACASVVVGGVGVVPAPAGSTSTPYVRGPGGLLVVAPEHSPAPVGATVCKSSHISGFRCGFVTALNVTIRFADGTTLTGLTRTSVCAEPGELGSPFVRVINGRVIAQGILVAASGNCSTGGVSYFRPILHTLNSTGLRLYTG